MTTVKIGVSKSYDVLIGSGLIDEVGRLMSRVTASRRAAVITDDIVGAIYAPRLLTSLSESGFDAFTFTIKNGEGSKNAANFTAALNRLAEKGLTRGDTIIALGGGVVGDLAGFTASAYLRGVRFVQVPTTLLAAVDSSVGGKTAINLDVGKNLAGSFHQPALVVCDMETFKTLPEQILRDGLSEVIKYGVIGNEKLFEHIAEKGGGFDREYVVSECVKMKDGIVSRDEFETGLRRILNFGHTVGHAVEKLSGFTVSHGSAVAIGMATVSRAAARAGICSESCHKQIISAIESIGLPTDNPFKTAEIYKAVMSDKKISGFGITVVLPERIGKCVLKEMPLDELKVFLEAGV